MDDLEKTQEGKNMSDFINRSSRSLAGGFGAALQSCDEEYRAQQDVQYLVMAEEIKRDKMRLERARAYLRSKTTDLLAVAKDIGALDA